MAEAADRQRTSEGNVDVEGMARRAGWVAQDEWDGKPEKWAPAEKYLDRMLGEMNPRAQEQFRTLDSRLAASEARAVNLEKTVQDATTIMSEFREYNQRIAEQSYARAKRELEAERDKAVTEADPEAHKEAIVALQKLEEQKPAPPPRPAAPPPPPPAAAAPPPPAEPHPDMIRWVQENPWYDGAKAGSDKLSGLAIGHFAEINNNSTTANLSLYEKLQLVRDEVKRVYPERFPDARPKAAATSDGASSGSARSGGGSKGRRFEDLPADAQAECKRFEGMMVAGKDGKKQPLVTREKYLADYDWS